MTSVIERFAGLSREEVHAFFTASDVVEITDVIRAASDDELRRLIADDDFREEGVVAILDRFAEFADTARLAQIDGVVRFELARSSRLRETHTARFADGTVALVPGAGHGRGQRRTALPQRPGPDLR